VVTWLGAGRPEFSFRHFHSVAQGPTQLPDMWASHLQLVPRLRMPGVLSRILRKPFEKFVDWRQCAAVMQREAVIVMPSCGGGNVVVA
jgi:hypothetical protein